VRQPVDEVFTGINIGGVQEDPKTSIPQIVSQRRGILAVTPGVTDKKARRKRR
jgi:hypothetical protein